MFAGLKTSPYFAEWVALSRGPKITFQTHMLCLAQDQSFTGTLSAERKIPPQQADRVSLRLRGFEKAVKPTNGVFCPGDQTMQRWGSWDLLGSGLEIMWKMIAWNEREFQRNAMGSLPGSVRSKTPMKRVNGVSSSC